jgi:hypothetical protein
MKAVNWLTDTYLRGGAESSVLVSRPRAVLILALNV